MNGNNSINLVREFEDSFDALIGVLANSNCQQSIETEELKLSVEQCVQKFIDKARELEKNFIQKRFQIVSQKPEQALIDDLNEVKLEIQRKDFLIERFNEKLNNWQAILSDNPLPPIQQNTMLITNQNPTSMMSNLSVTQNIQHQQQQQQLAPVHQPMNTMRQRSPIQQQPIIQTSITNSMPPSPMHQSPAGLRQTMMSPHPYQQPQPYTPQLQNQMMNTQPHTPNSSQQTNSMLPDSPMNYQINHPSMQSTTTPQYTPSVNQQSPAQSHLAFLEKTTSSIGLPDNRR